MHQYCLNLHAANMCVTFVILYHLNKTWWTLSQSSMFQDIQAEYLATPLPTGHLTSPISWYNSQASLYRPYQPWPALKGEFFFTVARSVITPLILGFLRPSIWPLTWDRHYLVDGLHSLAAEKSTSLQILESNHGIAEHHIPALPSTGYFHQLHPSQDGASPSHRGRCQHHRQKTWPG